jgi:hypothetical protein
MHNPLAAALWLPIACLVSVPVRAELPYEREPIDYLKAPTDDPVTRLERRIDQGAAVLKFDERHGWLPSLLAELGVPVDSQVLVFSKTSFQRTKISPATPRALYFNDETYVGFVQRGDVVEISTTDPSLGGVFYTVEQKPGVRPAILRQTHDCLQCHASSKTQEVPGHLVRSVFPDASGQPTFSAGTFLTSHESPLKERWGGWYVTGKHGTQTHMGNVLVADRRRPENLDTAAGANCSDLAGLVDTSPYLTGHSDIVALMVLEHQTKMHNLITAAAYHTRIALHYEEGINRALGRGADEVSASSERRIQSAAEKLLKYMLFVDEATLSEPVSGTSGFAEWFAARGPRDRQGRSLRDFDLSRRLFKYPCSYLIYSEVFDHLPAAAKDYIYRRLYEILTNQDQTAEYCNLSTAERQAVFEILRDTKPDLAATWDRR